MHEVRLLSDSGKSDYALVGEGFALSCLFMLDPDEVIHSVIWKKDGTPVSSFAHSLVHGRRITANSPYRKRPTVRFTCCAETRSGPKR